MSTAHDLAPLPRTEQRNAASLELDRLDTAAILRLINDQDATVPGVVRAALPALTELVGAALDVLDRGGRVHYFGAGASGRTALGDALELGPTYGVGPEIVCAHLAGGSDAAASAREHVEDHRETGLADAADVTSADLVIGVTASGRTPYVSGAFEKARAAGAATALLSCVPEDVSGEKVDVFVFLDTGAEVVTGSTRMKAGTAQKLALNSFSTTLMVKSGRTWSNLMVAASARNDKLRRRAVRTLMAACQVSEAEAVASLAEADGETPTALVALAAGVSPDVARGALAEHNGQPWAALRHLAGTPLRQRDGAPR
ncbi:N-acetylmuramic acid 6-phosphate etherase [Streptomyces sp. NPDC005151]